MDDTIVTVISSGRPESVVTMEQLLEGLDPLWVVPMDHGATYKYCGAKHVVEITPAQGSMALPCQRNAALDLAQHEGRWCVQFNDDLYTNRRFPTGTNVIMADGEEVSLHAESAIALIREGMVEYGALFGGIATTTNKFFYREPWSRQSFIMAHLMVMAPGCYQRFDTEMGVKEDYDFTLQHIQAGTALRANSLLGNFRHNEKKRGGCSPYRTEAYEQMMADRIVDRWAPHVVHNSRRPGEVLIKWKG